MNVGEDKDHPVTELLHSSPSSKGWQSPRFCNFPQIIVLQFKTPVILKRIQLLSHQAKIASKIELFVYLPTKDSSIPREIDRLSFKRIGHLSLGSNENNEFKARELKSVYVDNPAYLLKVAVHKCHINKYNIFNQVGIVAINCLGVALDSKDEYAEPSPIGQAFEEIGTFDAVTLEKLKELNIAKERAVIEENFDEAKRIKDIITRLRSIGKELASLDKKKTKAVENEDYELARLIKNEIDRVRDSALEYQPRSKPYTDHTEYTLTNEYLPMRNEYALEENKSFELPTGQDRVFRSPESILQSELKQSHKEVSGYLKEEMGESEVLPAVKNRERISVKSIAKPEGQIEFLSEESQKIAEPYYDLLEFDLIKKLFSKNWTNRESGLDDIQQELRTREFKLIKHTDDEKTVANLIGLIGYMANDNIPQVSIKAMDLIEELLNFYEGEITNYRSVYMSSVDQCMKSLMEKIGDGTANVRKKAKATCMRLAIEGKVPLETLALWCTKTDKKSSTRHFQKRLNLLTSVLQEFKESAKPLTSKPVIEFGVSGVKNGNEDVRNAGYSLLVEIYKYIGSDINNYLNDLRPAQRDVLQAEFDKLKPKSSHLQSKISEEPDKTCEYCGKYNPDFNQDNLDLHMLKDCSMLYLCPSCEKIIEIININSHLLTECKGKENFEACPTCNEAVQKHELDNHIEEGACNPVNKKAIRCPLCHMDISPATIEAWRNHILVQQCPNNDRRPI